MSFDFISQSEKKRFIFLGQLLKGKKVSEREKKRFFFLKMNPEHKLWLLVVNI